MRERHSHATSPPPASRRPHAATLQPFGTQSRAQVIDDGELLEAVETGKNMRIVLQPQYDLRKGMLVGAESLIRWRPYNTDTSPEHFIPALRRLGKEALLLEFVLREVRALLRSLRMSSQAMPISVNASASTLSTPGLIRAIYEDLRKDGIPARLIKIEVTEQSDAEDIRSLAADLRWMRSRGFGVSMDDFGTGTSTLERLTQLPFSELKIDRSFVQRMRTEPAAHAVVCAALDLGKRLGMKVVAEGIEDIDQLVQLKELGCHMGQGYILGKPLEMDVFMLLASTSTRPRSIE